jgi:hypothetical protein
MIPRRNRAHVHALGARVAELRKDYDMTQAEFARILGVSQQRLVTQIIDVLLEMNAPTSSVTSK